jgi:hypothetical protein
VAAIGFQNFDPFGIQFNVARPSGGHVDFLKNGFNRALGRTSVTVDALLWIDVKQYFILIEAIAGAHGYTIGVLAIVAGFTNDVSHGFAPFLNKVGTRPVNREISAKCAAEWLTSWNERKYE